MRMQRKTSAVFQRLLSPVTTAVSPLKFQTPQRQPLIAQKSSPINYVKQIQSPRLCLAKLDIWKPQQRENQVKLKVRDRNKVNEIVGAELHLNSPVRDSLLENGIDSVKHLKSSVLGRGAFGVVLAAIYKGRKVAVKLMTKRSSRRNSYEWCLLGEEQGKKLKKHPNLVEILDIFGFKGLHAMVVMEYAGDVNLDHLLGEAHQVMDQRRRTKFALDVCTGISWCHANCLAHLDVKPANIMVNEFDVCKLGDFGCSRPVANNEGVGWPGGTVAYTAPELLSGVSVSLKADIYSMAITMWQILTRKKPFEGLDTHTIIYKVVGEGIRPYEEEVIGKCKYVDLYHFMWNQRPTQRPNIQHCVQRLQQILLCS
ncbi:hypothetical protein CHUAL_000704 [Chamberlinius hualienensis]